MVAIAKRLAESKGGLPFVVFVAMLMGGAVGFVSIAMPTPLFERLVVMSRLPLILSAAEPPLGFTARTLLAVVTGLCAFAATLVGLRLIGGQPKRRHKAVTERPIVEQPVVEKPAVAKPTIGKSVTERIFRERRDESGEEAPRLRRADSHPDAPARRPIFAQEDLGESFDTFGDSLNELHLDPYAMPLAEPVEADLPAAPVVSHADEEPQAKRWDMPEIDAVPVPIAPPLVAEEPPLFVPPPFVPPAAAPNVAAPAPLPEVERAALSGDESIEDLVARFEDGLARRSGRKGKAERPSDSVRPFTAAGAPDDMDDALRDALDQLRRMTSRG